MAVIASVAMDLARDKEENKEKMTTFIEAAAETDVDLILFLELA